MNVDLERAGKALPLAVAAIYVAGFLVVAIHLAKYGTSSLELFRIQYLAAGFWCGFVFAFYFGLLMGVRSRIFESLHIRPQEKLTDAGAAWRAVWSWVLPNGVLMVMLSSGFLTTQRFSSSALFPSLSSLLFLCCWLAVIDLVHRGQELPRQHLPQMPPLFRGMFFGLTFLLYIFLFSEILYPYIQFSFGGGQPRSVVFVLNEGTSPASSFLVRDGAVPKTIPYQLLLENENSFVVISPKAGEKAIEFDRKSVAAMIVLESPKKP